MAWSPISGTLPQYQRSDGELASGYFIKFYATGTTTPIAMATDTSGGTTLAKCQLNSSAYPINGSSDPFIPHIDQTYKIAIYTNATDADNNTTANAEWIIDAIPVSISQISTVHERYTATAGQTVFTTTATFSTSNDGSLRVVINGSELSPDDYTKDSSTQFTLTTGANLNDEVDCYIT